MSGGTGARVRTMHLDPEAYARGAAEKLSNRTGTIEATDRPHSEGKVLVHFDEPVPSWWTHGSPVTAFWFNPSELKDER